MIILPNGEKVECEAGQVSDGYHTFDELYDHRCTLFLLAMCSNPDISWASTLHADGTMFDGWFVAGMELPTGRITYHLPARLWNFLPDHPTLFRYLDRAPEHDGHTSADVLKRMQDFLAKK